jgi:hypothetical protein
VIDLPPLPLEEWRPTKDTLHLWVQIVGKVRTAHMPTHNHWWHSTLYVSARGLTTGRIPVGDTSLEIDFDLIDHELHLTTRDAFGGFALNDGLSVGEFYREIMSALEDLDVATTIRPQPSGLDTTTPYPDDFDEHLSYDEDAATRFHRVLAFADTALQEFAGWYSGKSSPVHLFWHSFDLAHSRFWAPAGAGEQEVAFGFWAGDDITPAPTFYSYTSPHPDGLEQHPLRPDAATWFVQPNGATAHLPYEAARASADPHGSVLEFFQSAYRGGASLSGWDVAGMATEWAALGSGQAAQGQRSGDG